MKKFSLVLLFTVYISMMPLNAQYAEFEVSVKGEGTPVMLIPGFTCTEKVWEETVAKLSEDYECHTFTLAGFGGVQPIEFPWLPKIKDALLNYVKDKNLTDVVVVGHSLGGALAMWMATENEALFKKLIVVDALPSTGAVMVPDFKPENMVYDNPYSQRLLTMDSTNFKAMAKQMASFMALNTKMHPQLTDWIVQSDRKTYVNGYTDLLKLDLREAIAQISIPVTILAATHPNKEMIKAQYEKQFVKMPHRKILYAEDAAHFIMYDQPEWFMTTLISELEQSE